MKDNRNRCYNCNHREDGGEGDTWCKKRQTGYRAEQYDCEDFEDIEKCSSIYDRPPITKTEMNGAEKLELNKNLCNILCSLAHCPFCGGDAVVSMNRDGIYVECEECGCQTKKFVTIVEAADRWNTRKDKLFRRFNYED